MTRLSFTTEIMVQVCQEVKGGLIFPELMYLSLSMFLRNGNIWHLPTTKSVGNPIVGLALSTLPPPCLVLQEKSLLFTCKAMLLWVSTKQQPRNLATGFVAEWMSDMTWCAQL